MTAVNASESAAAFELGTPAAQQNPYAVYARWRSTQPVYRAPTGEWFLTRYDDVSSVLGDTDRFSNSLVGTRLYQQRIRRLQIDDSDILFGDFSMVNMDPPDHTRLRRLVSKAFTPKAVAGLRPRIEQIVDGLVDRLDGQADLMSQFAYPLPVTVICELLGVPAADRDQFRTWNQQMIDNPDLSFEDVEALQRSQEAMRHLVGYMQGLIAERHRRPADDLLSSLVAVEEAGEQLTERELLTTAILLFIAGHETTVNLIGNGVLALLTHPAQLRRLRADPSLMDSAIEEMLRYDSPVQAVSRGVRQDVALGGAVLKRGDLVMCLVGAANRDPGHFPNPDVFDLGRRDNRHLSFGRGIHFCLGAPLARLEARVALPALLRRFPRIELATDQPRWRPSPLLRGLAELPVRAEQA
jgi:cytochrome P450